MVSTCLASAAVGSTIGAGLAEKFGRKGTLMLDVVPLLAGALIGATAQSLNAMIAGRVLIGVGIGLASALVPTYISEVPPPDTPHLYYLNHPSVMSPDSFISGLTNQRKIPRSVISQCHRLSIFRPQLLTRFRNR